jgi:hypothetical protein
LPPGRIGDAERMGIGVSIFLFAVGAILKFAVTAHVSGVSLATVGTILMIVGVVGLLISLFMLIAWSDRDRVPRERYVERDRPI